MGEDAIVPVSLSDGEEETEKLKTIEKKEEQTQTNENKEDNEKEKEIEKEDKTDKTPPKVIKKRKSNNNEERETIEVLRKWGRLLSLHPSLPHYDLSKETLNIGRKRESDLVLKEPTISSRHCKITLNTNLNQAFIEDLSSNGTYVNGGRIPKGKLVPIKNHDRIAFVVSGGLTYLYEDLILANHLGKEIQDDDESGIDRDYMLYEKLGEGAFSTVRLAVHKRTKEKRAIKIIDLSRHPNPRAQQHIQREINILMKIDHPNIAKIKDVYLGKRCKVFLVMELAEGGELFDKGRIADEGACGEDEARQLVDALHYLHNRGIAHRDLKPENILLQSKTSFPHVMITDFGLARILEGNELAQTQCGTPQYVAPEVLMLTNFGSCGGPSSGGPNSNLPGMEGGKLATGGARGGYGKECDMWSLGGILYVLLSGVPPFREQDTVTGLNLVSRIEKGIFDFPYDLWSGVSDEATDLVTKLLTVDRQARYTTDQAMCHPWTVQKIEKLPSSSSLSSSSSSSSSSSDSVFVSPSLPSTPRVSRNPLAPILSPNELMKPPSTPSTKKIINNNNNNDNNTNNNFITPSSSPSSSISSTSTTPENTPSKTKPSSLHKSKSFAFSKRSFEIDDRENSETFLPPSNTPLKKLKLI